MISLVFSKDGYMKVMDDDRLLSTAYTNGVFLQDERNSESVGGFVTVEAMNVGLKKLWKES